MLTAGGANDDASQWQYQRTSDGVGPAAAPI